MNEPECCGNCRYFSAQRERRPDAMQEYGACQRHAPIAVVDFGSRKMWPQVQGSQWCGDWEPGEAK